MTAALPVLGPYWRIGYHADPTGYTPWELYASNHRFDDPSRRFRTLYVAELPETCLREVLADYRPNLAAQQRHIERFGPEAAKDFAPHPITAQWRRQHVLVSVDQSRPGALIASSATTAGATGTQSPAGRVTSGVRPRWRQTAAHTTPQRQCLWIASQCGRGGKHPRKTPAYDP